MGLFNKPEVTVLKESSDAKAYLAKLEQLYDEIKDNQSLADKVGKEIAITKAGIIGEDQILFELKNSGMDIVVLHDIYIEDSAGNGAQIDFLVLAPYVNVFIECKNLVGNIEINNKGDFIRSFEYGKKYHKEGIYSPITQNERHMRIYKDIRRDGKGMITGALFLKNFDNYNKSLVVLANPKTVVNDRFAPAVIKNQVIRCDQLIKTLRNMKSDFKNSKKEMLALGEKILAMNIEERKDYFVKFEELKKEIEAENNQPTESQKELPKEENDKKICPKCGKELVLRTAKKGDNQGNQFWGCSGFPYCRYIEGIK